MVGSGDVRIEYAAIINCAFFPSGAKAGALPLVEPRCSQNEADGAAKSA
jgi:hypothetical protein